MVKTPTTRSMRKTCLGKRILRGAVTENRGENCRVLLVLFFIAANNGTSSSMEGETNISSSLNELMDCVSHIFNRTSRPILKVSNNRKKKKGVSIFYVNQ